MQNKINSYVLSQFGASIQMLENAVEMCPEHAWNQTKDSSDFWYIAYHTIFWLDFYLTESPEEFKPFQNFGITEFDPEGILPDKVYSKEELQEYINHCKNKCKTTIENINEVNADKIYKFGSIEIPFFELMIYNMRHVQHHTAQLNLMLRQRINSATAWVKRKTY